MQSRFICQQTLRNVWIEQDRPAYAASDGCHGQRYSSRVEG